MRSLEKGGRFVEPRRAVVLPLVLCAGLILPGCTSERIERDEPPNVVVILIDTLRKDHLHLYGYDRRTSDYIDSLGERGWVFDNHIASAGQTVPSTLSMLLSLHPVEHGFLHVGDGHFARNRPRYPDDLLFLAEVFRENGYATAGFVGNPFLQRENGFDQGFDTFVYSDERADTLTRPSIDWLRERANEPGRPFFLYLHYFDVHWPYDPPAAFRRFPSPEGGELIYKNGLYPDADPEDLAATEAMYDAGIAYVDSQIAQVVQTIVRLDQHEQTIVVVTSDHGDEFLEHGGLGHGTSVYGELVRAPLVLVYPGTLEPGRRIPYLTAHVDLAPTLLDLSGIPRPPHFRGNSLMQPTRRAFAEDGPWATVYNDRRKVILNRNTGATELFAADDELDQNPLSDPETQARLLEHLVWYQGLEMIADTARRDTGVREWSNEELDRLRSLGYLQ